MEIQRCTATDFGLATARISAMLSEANQSNTSAHTAVGDQVFPTFVFSLIRLPAAVAWLVEFDSDKLDRAHELAERILLPTMHARAPMQALLPEQWTMWENQHLLDALSRIVRDITSSPGVGWPLSVTPVPGDDNVSWFNCASASDSSHKFAVELDKISLRRGPRPSSASSEWELGTRGFLRGVSMQQPHYVVINCIMSLMWQTLRQQEHYARLRIPYPSAPDGHDEQMAHDLLALVIMSHIFTKRTDAHLDARRIDGDFRAALSELTGTEHDNLHHFAGQHLLPTGLAVRRALVVLARGLPAGHTPRELAELTQDVHAALAWTRFRFQTFDDELDQEPRRGLSDLSLGTWRSGARRVRGRRTASASMRF